MYLALFQPDAYRVFRGRRAKAETPAKLSDNALSSIPEGLKVPEEKTRVEHIST